MALTDLLIAVVMGLVIFGLGLWAVRGLAMPREEPDPEAVIPVRVEYRCSVCGTRVVMTHAQGSDPEPPKHCRETMDPVA